MQNPQENIIKSMAGQEQPEPNEGTPQEEGSEVEMPMQDFMMEHQHLIELLREAGEKYGDQELIAEATQQEQEMAKYQGGEQPQGQQPQGQPVPSQNIQPNMQ